MNVNKKFDRLRQWGKEKMGAEIKTGPSDVFKALEAEMNIRQEGIKMIRARMKRYVKSLNKLTQSSGAEKIHSAMSGYVKFLNKRVDDDGSKAARNVLGSLSSAMVRHGEDFEEKSVFGQCLSKMGLANETIARAQDVYAAQASATWLESLDRSLAQMRDYQNARKKLDSRRLAYDTSLGKMQKAKRDDYRTEEEVRCQRIKFEESSEEVQRRMQDIIDYEPDNVAELTSFLEAELDYHERCRDILLRLKTNWPGPPLSTTSTTGRGPGSHESATNQACSNSLAALISREESENQALRRPAAPFRNDARSRSANSSPHREVIPALPRSNNSEFYSVRNQTPLSTIAARDVRPRVTTGPVENVFGDDDGDSSSSPEHHSFWENSSTTRSSSPATTASYPRSRNGSLSTADTLRAASCGINGFSADSPSSETSRSGTALVNKPPPPPPPPSRGAKRPPPPPPPMKRSALSTSAVPYAA